MARMEAGEMAAAPVFRNVVELPWERRVESCPDFFYKRRGSGSRVSVRIHVLYTRKRHICIAVSISVAPLTTYTLLKQ